jgi:hypothetical protein
MADDDPPPDVDRNHQAAVNPTVLAFLAAMDSTGTEMDAIGPVVRKLFDYKVSLYLSIPDPTIPDAVRNKFAKWLNQFSQYNDLKGGNLQITNCNDEFIFVPSLLYDNEFQKLTGWETVKSGATRNVHLCVKIKSAVSFSRLKHRMLPFLFENNILMKRNQSLGDSTAEMATIGYLSPIHPDLLLDHIQLGLNKELQCIKAQQEEDYLVEHGVRRGVLGDLVIAHGSVRGSSKQHGDVVNTKAVIVECPKNKTAYYMKHIQEALRTFDWSPDLKKVKFVPFALKSDSKTKDVFTNMIVYNSLENDKKAYVQILGVSCEDMEELRDKFIADGPNITHIEPTRLSAKQGRWRIYTSKDNRDNVEKWLTLHLVTTVNSISMRVPVPGFATPRLVITNSVSHAQVQDIAAIANTVPDLDNALTFPHLVVNRGRANPRRGAWTQSGPPLISTYGTPTHAKTTPSFVTPQNASHAKQSHRSPDFLDITKQLSEFRTWREKLEKDRQEEKQQRQALTETVNNLRKELEEEKVALRKLFDDSAAAFENLAAGQAEIQQAMIARDQHNDETFTAMRAEMIALTVSVRELLNFKTSPRKVPQTYLDKYLDDSDDDSDSPRTAQKRSPDRSASKQNPRLRKDLRTTEGMNTSDDPSTRQP